MKIHKGTLMTYNGMTDEYFIEGKDYEVVVGGENVGIECCVLFTVKTEKGTNMQTSHCTDERNSSLWKISENDVQKLHLKEANTGYACRHELEWISDGKESKTLVWKANEPKNISITITINY